MLDKKYLILLTIFMASVLIIVFAHASYEAVNGNGSTGATFSMIDKDGDGLITREEFEDEKSLFDGRTFDSLDFGGKGFITQSDLKTAGIDLDANAIGSTITTGTTTKSMPAKPKPRPAKVPGQDQKTPPPEKPEANSPDQINRPGS